MYLQHVVRELRLLRAYDNADVLWISSFDKVFEPHDFTDYADAQLSGLELGLYITDCRLQRSRNSRVLLTNRIIRLNEVLGRRV